MRAKLPPPGRIKQALALALVLVSFFLLWRYGGRHTGSIEWGYRILYALPALLGFLLIQVRRLRWAVGAILCACITISYLDRNTMGLAVTAIRDSGDIPSPTAISPTWSRPSCSRTRSLRGR
jgi:predicted benzoate:H+ symporter BenE